MRWLAEAVACSDGIMCVQAVPCVRTRDMRKKSEKYLIDERGRKTAVVLDIAAFRALLERLEDLKTLWNSNDGSAFPPKDSALRDERRGGPRAGQGGCELQSPRSSGQRSATWTICLRMSFVGRRQADYAGSRPRPRGPPSSKAERAAYRLANPGR